MNTENDSIEVIQRDKSLFGQGTEVAVHILEPTLDELEQAYARAEINGYKTIVVYDTW